MSALVAAGVRIWFGNSTGGPDSDRLTAFYERLGFTIVPGGLRLPPFLGLDWDPALLDVSFWFWQRLRPPDQQLSSFGTAE